MIILLHFTIIQVLAHNTIATMAHTQSCNMGSDQRDQDSRSTPPNISSDSSGDDSSEKEHPRKGHKKLKRGIKRKRREEKKKQKILKVTQVKVLVQ